jgi:regulator of cell morphogenesis and NO signaling
MITKEKTVAEIALETPRAAAIFQEFGIDYCCDGEVSLAEACAAAKVGVAELEQALAEVRTAVTNAEKVDWNAQPVYKLVEHIIGFHHLYVRRALPRIDHLLGNVLTAHGQKHHEIAQVQRHFHVVADEMVRHMLKEEQILFPHIIKLEEAAHAREKIAPSMFGTVRNPIRMMRAEHDTALGEMKAIRKISRDFDAPKEGCNSFRALYQAVEEFEHDLQQHIHLENDILFPRAEALEERVK